MHPLHHRSAKSNELSGPAHPSAKWMTQAGEDDSNPDNEGQLEK